MNRDRSKKKKLKKGEYIAVAVPVAPCRDGLDAGSVLQ